MTRRLRFGVITLVSCGILALAGPFTAAGTARQASTPGQGKDRAAIEAVLQAHVDNWNRHDMDAWADAILHEDSDWVNWRGGYWRGKAAITAGHKVIHQGSYKNSRLTPQRIEDLTFLTPDMVLVHARSELSGDERAPGTTFPYRKTILLTRAGGAWKIRALHNTRLLDKE